MLTSSLAGKLLKKLKGGGETHQKPRRQYTTRRREKAVVDRFHRLYYDSEVWLSVNRLISHKRVDVQLKAVEKMPGEKLIVVGSYEQSRQFKKYAKYVEKIKPDNVELRSWVPEGELADLYANCRGFVTTSRDEDFGLNAVEAMASGKPVIVPDEGGYRETVVDGETGKLLEEVTPEKLAAAVKEVGGRADSYGEACLKQAKKFDTAVFKDKILELTKDTRN